MGIQIAHKIIRCHDPLLMMVNNLIHLVWSSHYLTNFGYFLIKLLSYPQMIVCPPTSNWNNSLTSVLSFCLWNFLSLFCYLSQISILLWHCIIFNLFTHWLFKFVTPIFVSYTLSYDVEYLLFWLNFKKISNVQC